MRVGTRDGREKRRTLLFRELLCLANYRKYTRKSTTKSLLRGASKRAIEHVAKRGWKGIQLYTYIGSFIRGEKKQMKPNDVQTKWLTRRP